MSRPAPAAARAQAVAARPAPSLTTRPQPIASGRLPVKKEEPQEKQVPSTEDDGNAMDEGEVAHCGDNDVSMEDAGEGHAG